MLTTICQLFVPPILSAIYMVKSSHKVIVWCVCVVWGIIAAAQTFLECLTFQCQVGFNLRVMGVCMYVCSQCRVSMGYQMLVI